MLSSYSTAKKAHLEPRRSKERRRRPLLHCVYDAVSYSGLSISKLESEMNKEADYFLTQHLVVMGVSAAGKTTVAQLLAEQLGWPLAEADEFHPANNIAKMQAGIPLTDEDRWPWLAALRDWMSEQAAAGQSTVVTCSALKQVYRDLLREAKGEVKFIYLHGERELLLDRMAHRHGHFMPISLLDSQLATLQPPTPAEQALTLEVSAVPAELVRQVLAALNLPKEN